MKCRKKTESENPKVARKKNGRVILLSKCAVFDSKKSKFIKEQEASGLLSTLKIKTCLVETLKKFYCVSYVAISWNIRKFLDGGFLWIFRAWAENVAQVAEYITTDMILRKHFVQMPKSW